MKPLFNIDDLHLSQNDDFLPLECEWCGNTFRKNVKEIKRALPTSSKAPRKETCKFCSNKCRAASTNTSMILSCFTCKAQIIKQKCEVSKFNFCSSSCFAKHNNVHRKSGTKRSKIEFWLQEQLLLKYPTLSILYNDTSSINAELDIYVPSLKLAFELNGIFHYEPIYGPEKLASIQNNDNRKFQTCLEQKIELVIIDISALKYFKPKNAQKYLDIVTNIIDDKWSKVKESNLT